MINKKEFDLLLQEISQIENKIVEIKVLNQFDKANEYEIRLENIREKAKDISLNQDGSSTGFDELSLSVFVDLISLDSDIDYYILEQNNVIESREENIIDAAALKKIKELWENLERHVNNWENSEHNPIEELEYNKAVGKITLEIIIYQLQIEGVINFPKVFSYCRQDSLVNAVKELLFEGASQEEKDDIRRRRLISMAKDISEVDLFDYKLWQQLLMIKDVRSRDDHIEIMGNFNDLNNRKYEIEESKRKISKSQSEESENKEIESYSEGSIFGDIKKWFREFRERIYQKRMMISWNTINGPAFRVEYEKEYEEDEEYIKYYRNHLDKYVIENAKILTVASNGVAKYNFDKGAEWKHLEEIEFLSLNKTSSEVLSPDKTYNCIGNNAFANCPSLRKVTLGKIEIIGDKAFENCANLSEIVFGKKLMNISEDAFENCISLRKVEFVSDPKLFILDRPQNILNCFKGTSLEEITFNNINSAFNFAITDCPNLKHIYVSSIPGITIPFKVCKYRLGREEGIVAFVGEKALNLWKKKNSAIRFFELTDEDKKNYNVK